MVPGTHGTEPISPVGEHRAANDNVIAQDTRHHPVPPVDLCRLCVLLLLGLEGAQVAGLL